MVKPIKDILTGIISAGDRKRAEAERKLEEPPMHSPLTPQEQLLADRTMWAVAIAHYHAQQVVPFLDIYGGPRTPEDEEWGEEVRQAAAYKRARPVHPEPDIEDVLNQMPT